MPGVAFDLASFSFHVPSCRSAAKDTAPAKEQIATVNPIVLIFMALIETGFRSVVNAFLGLPINVEVLVNCQSAGSDQRNVLRAYRSPLPWPGRGEGEGRCSAIGSESLASWQLEFEPLTFILSPSLRGEAALLQPQLTINEHYQINVRTAALLPGAVTPAQDWAAHVFRVLAEPALSEVEGAFRPSEIPLSLCFHAK